MAAMRFAGMELGVPPLLQVFVQIKFLYIKQRVISCLIRVRPPSRRRAVAQQTEGQLRLLACGYL